MSCCHFRKYSPECISNSFLFPPHCSLWVPTHQPMSKATNLQDMSDLCPDAAVGSQNWNVIHIIDVWGQFYNAAIEMGAFICSPHVRRCHSPSFLIRFSFPLFNHKSSILLIRVSSSDLPHPYIHPRSLYSLPTSHPRPTPLILFLVHPPSAPPLKKNSKHCTSLWDSVWPEHWSLSSLAFLTYLCRESTEPVRETGWWAGR